MRFTLSEYALVCSTCHSSTIAFVLAHVVPQKRLPFDTAVQDKACHLRPDNTDSDSGQCMEKGVFFKKRELFQMRKNKQVLSRIVGRFQADHLKVVLVRVWFIGGLPVPGIFEAEKVGHTQDLEKTKVLNVLVEATP